MSNIHTHKRFWVGFDRHCPEHDPAIDEIALDFIRDFKPHIRVAGGDWQSVDQVTKWNNESTLSLEAEFKMNAEALERFGITHYLEGNHEERLRRVGNLLDPRLRSLVGLVKNLDLVKRGIKFRPYHPTRGVLRFGKLKILHGWYCNEYMAKKTALTYGTCVFGHAHRFQTFWPKAAFDNHVGFSIGMMGKIEQPYEADRPPAGHSQGFVFGYMHTNGYFDLYPVRIVGKQVTINGRVYRR